MNTLKEEGHRFLNSTSVKGLSRIVKAKGRSKKTLWIVGVLGLGALCTFFTTRLVEQYISYPKSTTAYKSSNKEAEGISLLKKFTPFITVCNNLPIQSTFLNEINITEDFHFSDLFLNIGLERARQMGHQTIVASCFYLADTDTRLVDYFDCSSLWNYFPSPWYFNCYVLKLNLTNHPPDHIYLDLLFYADNFEIAKIDDYTGINAYQFEPHIFLHLSPHAFPISTPDIAILPGQDTRVELSLVLTENLPSPYGKCVYKPLYDSIYSLHGQKLPYSKLGCQFAVYQNKLMKECGCAFISDVLGHQNNNLSYKNTCTTVCNSSYSSHMCPNLCQRVEYQRKRITYLPWMKPKQVFTFYKKYIQNKEFEDKFRETLESEDNQNMNRSKQMKLYELTKDNFAKVFLEIDLSEFVMYKEFPQFSLVSFIGQLGGVLNLYSGISFVIIIELADFFLSMCCNFVKCGKRTQVSEP